MNNIIRSTVSMVALILCFSFVAMAQELTGTIEGTVTDPNGAVVPGVEVTITARTVSGSAGFRRTATTDQNGFYRVQQIPPGTYNVTTAAAAGFGSGTANNVQVVLGRSTPVNFTLAAGGQSVTVDVAADSLAIDTTATKIQTNITQRTAELLPKGTNFTSLLQIAPSVRAEPLGGGFQIDGASGSENTFIIDGQEVSNFRTGTLNANNDIPFQIVQEVQVKSSGFEAEFGGATGGVINVVTRGGGNEFRGEAGVEFNTERLNGRPNKFLNLTTYQAAGSTTNIVLPEYIQPNKDSGTNFFPFFSIGGPILKDKLWFFASYAPQYLNTQRTVNLYGTSAAERDPARRQFVSSNTYNFERKNEHAFGRLDWQTHSRLRFNASYMWNPIAILGNPPGTSPFGSIPAITFPGRGLVSGPQLANFQGGRRTSNNTTGSLTWNPTDKLIVTARAGYSFLNEKMGNYGVPPVAGVIRFSAAQCDTGVTPLPGFLPCGTQSFPGFNELLFDVSRRRTYDADASYLVSDFGGRHQIKGGMQWNGISNSIQSTLKPKGIAKKYCAERDYTRD